jgi:aspartate/methionine/tyrosine aminotransferase
MNLSVATNRYTLSAVKEMELLSQGIKDSISLAQGIPTCDTPNIIKDAAIRAINDGLVAAYSPPQGLPLIRQKIARKLKENGQNYDWQDEIFITAGASEAIAAALRGLISPDKNQIILSSPSYAGYRSMVYSAGAIAHYVPLVYPEWSLDISALRASVSEHTAAILLAHPNNPTGSIFSKQELLTIIELAEKYDFYIISDEVYSDLILDNIEFISPASLSKERVIRIHSFSKSFAMTGWRVAYMHGQKELMKRILPAHDAIITCAPVVSQYAAIAALDNYDHLTALMRQMLKKHRNVACSQLEIAPNDNDYPQAAYFIFLPTPKINQDFAKKILKDTGISTVPGSAFGPTCSNFIRICFGRDIEQVKLGCGKIKKYIDEF